MFDLTAPPAGFHDNPWPHYAAMRDAGLVPQADGSFIVSRYADLDMIYRDTRRFISDKKEVFRPKFGDSPLYEHHTTSLVFNDPPLHTRVRKIMVGAMNPRALASMEPGLITLIDSLLADMAGHEQIDMIDAFAGAIPIEVIGNLFDIPHEERGMLRGWSLAILGALEPKVSAENMALGNQAVVDFKAFLADLTARRRANPGDPNTDVLTRLMQSEDGALSEIELFQNCIFILNAGHETTTNLISNALLSLCEDLRARAQLLAEPDLINTAVDEFLRFESPNQFGNRLTAEPTEMHGQVIPAGTDLHMCIGAANRDPDQFEDPERLILDRRPNKHLAFAGGAHTCVGLTLARMEGRIAVNGFLNRFPNYDLASPPVRGNRMRFRGLTSMRVRLDGADGR
ncbi:MAG: cytochrome P450 [Pikeienuella sp.]